MSQTSPPHIGGQLHKLRKDRGLSLRALASKCQLSANAISLIERGATSPNVNTLHRLAQALGIAAQDFFLEQKPNVVIGKCGKYPIAQGKGVLIESLGCLTEQPFNTFWVTLAGGAGVGKNIVHTGQELVICLSGNIEYHIEDQKYQLTAQDSLAFQAHLPHCWRNPADVPAQLLLIVYASTDIGRVLQQHLQL